MAVFLTILIIAIIAAAAYGAYRWSHSAGRAPRLELKPLADGDETYYRDSWNNTQGAFVDHPATALSGADNLVTQLLNARGYTASDRETLISELGQKHHDQVAGYRRALDVVEATKADETAATNGTGSGSLSTEEMRQALLDLRSLSEALLDDARASVPNRKQSITSS